LDQWACHIRRECGHVKARQYVLSSKQNFINTLIAFLQTVHSFLSCTLDEH
jgi:hypothetical protein